MKVLRRSPRSIVILAVLLSIAIASPPDKRSSLNEKCIQWQTFIHSLPRHRIGTVRSTACRIRVTGRSGSMPQKQKQKEEKESEDSQEYEFGTMIHLAKEQQPSLMACLLHNHQAKDVSLLSRANNTHSTFEIAVMNHDECDNFHWGHMAFDVDPLGPNIVPIQANGVYANQNATDTSVGICRYREEFMGRMFLNGPYFGHCAYFNSSSGAVELVGGDFQVLNALPKSKEKDRLVETNQLDRYAIVRSIEQRIESYLSPQHLDLLESVSGYSIGQLLDDLNNTAVTDYPTLNRVLSTDRFIPHGPLNQKGLSIFRAVLAEQMTLVRRRQFGLHHHPDTVEWERDGVLLKDFDHFQQHPQQLEDLLKMAAASPQSGVKDFEWVERNVTSSLQDPQREPHIDTFHSVVKLWVYERGVVNLEEGPLHFVRGSNRNSRAKLEWIHRVSLPPATEATKEPSLRFRDKRLDGQTPLPVLPLEEYPRTLIIADTSGIHHRGQADPGRIRTTIRLVSGNDGGLPRLNPFVWNGWEMPLECEA